MTSGDEIVCDNSNRNRDVATSLITNSDHSSRNLENESYFRNEVGNRPNEGANRNFNWKQLSSYITGFQDWWICTNTITKVKILAFVILPCLAVGLFLFHSTEQPGSLYNPIAVLHPLSVVHPVIPSPFHSTIKLIKETAKDLLSISADISVNTNKGPIIGQKVSPDSATGASYDAFLGIKYGHIPTRFQRAIPPDSWASPKSAKSDGPACPQPRTRFSEDCLFINVYTPRGAVDSSSVYPVIAFIHGSSFTRNSSSSKRYGPHFLVPKGVILVTFNYRLGANGFLTLGSRDAPGNMGLYDTHLALRWVKDEIRHFGGDPSQVTLMGHEAGAVLAMYHYLSPMSDGLFRYVITHSGSAFADWGHYSDSEGRRRAKSLAAAVGCNSSADDAQILACLSVTNITYLVGNQSVPMDIHFNAAGQTMAFLPVLDTDFADSPFFTDSLNNLLDMAANRSKPLMLGFTTDEGIVKFAEDSCWMNVEANLDAFIPPHIASTLSRRRIAEVVTSIRRRYWDLSITDSKVWNIVRILGDHMMVYPALQVADRLANSSYGYEFNFKGPWTPDPPYISKFHVSGVNHNFDLRYLFYDSEEPQDLGNSSSLGGSVRVRDMMLEWWTNFVKTGSPGGDWTTISQGGYLKINTNKTFVDSATMKNDHNYDFWSSLETLQDTSFANRNSLMSILAAFCCMLVTVVL